MRIAALILTVAAALASLWFFAVSQGLILPGAAETAIRDDYLEVARARAYLPFAMLGLFNGALTLALWQRAQRWTLWVVLAGGLLVLAFIAWDYFALSAEMPSRIPTYFHMPESTDGFDEMLQRMKLRRLLLWTGVGLTLAGWLTWLAFRFRKAGL